MKCQILFSRKNKKNIANLSSAESAHSIVSVKEATCAREFPHTVKEIKQGLNFKLKKNEISPDHGEE